MKKRVTNLMKRDQSCLNKNSCIFDLPEELFNEIKDSGLQSMGKASHFFGKEVGYG